MTLLDTNAIIWLLTEHPRAHLLRGPTSRIAVSPVSLLEIQFLVEVGRLEAMPGPSVAEHIAHRAWRIDSPSTLSLFDAAMTIDWTRDPFDRLIVAHARLRRWPLATGDRRLLTMMDRESVIAL